MPPKKKVTHMLSSEVVQPEPHIEALLQTEGALDHNVIYDNEDDTLTHHIPQIAYLSLAKTLTGAAGNASQNVKASTKGLKGPSLQDIGRSIGFATLQGAQAKAFTANTTTTDLLLQPSQQAPPPSQVNQDQRDFVIPDFAKKPSTHRMCVLDHLFHAHGHKVFPDSQMS
jgi:hypothetical protein